MADRLPMVGWYDPGQLVRTAVDVLVSTIFGRHADHRVLDALGRQDFAPYDYSKHADGRPRRCSGSTTWPTPATAGTRRTPSRTSLAQPTLAVDVDGRSSRRAARRRPRVRRRRGVSRRQHAEYRTSAGSSRRTARPSPTPSLHTPRPSPSPEPRLVRQPRRLHAHLLHRRQAPVRRRGRPARRAATSRIKLPHGWWLIGTDVQLESDIDDPQLEYFRNIADAMAPEDRIILCHGEPNWITSAAYEKWDPEASERNLVYLEEKVLGGRVRVFLCSTLDESHDVLLDGW